jgi:hypothetical protein
MPLFAKVFLFFTLFLIAGPTLVSSIAINSDTKTLIQFPALQPSNTTGSIINSTSMNSTDVVSTKLLRMKVTLPYWTSMVGGSISFIIAVSAITWDWHKHESDDTLWSFSLSSLFSAFGLLFTFIQNLALLINIIQNHHNLGMITPLTGNTYIILFACSATLSTPRVVWFIFPLIVGWINVGMAMANFVFLSLPAVGTVGLYEAYSPYCTVLFDAKSTSGCNKTTVQDVFGGGSFMCAQQGPSLGFGASPRFLPIIADWAYAVVIIVLLMFMLRRQVMSRVTGKAQPVGYAGTSLFSHTALPSCHSNLSFLIIGKAMACVILGSLGLAITAWYFASKASAEGSVGVCPQISNATMGPIKGNVNVARGCTCVEIRMPGYVANVGEVLREDEGTLSRLIFDIA